MNFWSILEIDPTDDISTIKKAYAKKLKLHTPEDDPIGYQNLREAYDSALKNVKFIKSINEDSSENITNSEQIQVKTYHDLSFSSSSIEEISSFNQISFQHSKVDLSEVNLNDFENLYKKNTKFMLEVEALYNNFFARIDIDNWKALLNNDVMWNIENRENITKLMFDFLAAHHYLPQEIWILLDSDFNWNDSENFKYGHNNEEFLKYVKKQITQKTPLRYSFFNTKYLVDFESFLENREKAYDCILENSLSATDLYVKKAKQIYENDPDLLLIEGKLNLKNENFDNAILVLSELLLIEADNSDAILFRATAYLEKNQLDAAIKDYENAYNKSPADSDIPLILTKSYLKLGELKKAKDYVLKAIDLNPLCSEAKALRSQINARIKIKLSNELKNDPYNAQIKSKLYSIEREILQKNNVGSFKPIETPLMKRPYVKLGILIFICILILLAAKYL